MQEALDNIMADSKLITIVIAHRLSTIRGANKIAYVDNGKVREIGTYEELMAKPNGRYKRLEELQTLDQGTDRTKILEEKKVDTQKEEEADKSDVQKGAITEVKEAEEVDKEKAKVNEKKAKDLAKSEMNLFIYGSIGALLNGLT